MSESVHEHVTIEDLIKRSDILEKVHGSRDILTGVVETPLSAEDSALLREVTTKVIECAECEGRESRYYNSNKRTLLSRIVNLSEVFGIE